MPLTVILPRVLGRCMRFIIRLFAVACLAIAAFSAGPASAEKRVALFIGNGAYVHATALPNPANDAAGVVRMLATGMSLEGGPTHFFFGGPQTPQDSYRNKAERTAANAVASQFSQ